MCKTDPYRIEQQTTFEHMDYCPKCTALYTIGPVTGYCYLCGYTCTKTDADYARNPVMRGK